MSQMVLGRRVHFKPPASSVLEVPGILGRLAEVKLQRETSSDEPSLRHYLGHSGVFRKCLTAAEEEAEQPVAVKLKKEPYPAPPKPHQFNTHHIRAQVIKTMKAIVTRRPVSQPLVDNLNEIDLTRGQARGPAMSETVPRHHSASKLYLGYNPFTRLKQKIYDKSVG
ncbi:hypothetical protein BDV18DRAFT_157759 [Aspergillus unguis]